MSERGRKGGGDRGKEDGIGEDEEGEGRRIPTDLEATRRIFTRAHNHAQEGQQQQQRRQQQQSPQKERSSLLFLHPRLLGILAEKGGRLERERNRGGASDDARPMGRERGGSWKWKKGASIQVLLPPSSSLGVLTKSFPRLPSSATATATATRDGWVGGCRWRPSSAQSCFLSPGGRSRKKWGKGEKVKGGRLENWLGKLASASAPAEAAAAEAAEAAAAATATAAVGRRRKKKE